MRVSVGKGGILIVILTWILGCQFLAPGTGGMGNNSQPPVPKKKCSMELVELGRFDLILYTLELEHQGLGNIILDPRCLPVILAGP